MIVRGRGSEEFVLEWDRIYPLQDPVRFEGKRYAHARAWRSLGDPWRINLELFEQDREPTTCEHGFETWHPVRISEREEVCNGRPSRPPQMWVGQERIANTLTLPRYDPMKDPSTFEGSMMVLALAIHEAEKERKRR